MFCKVEFGELVADNRIELTFITVLTNELNHV